MSGNTCNTGLQCADDVNQCVTVGPPGTGGTGVSTGTGGTSSGTGGMVSTGGSSATGGASGGAGGAHATGGGGGGSATGGSPGTGGTGQTGGTMGSCFPAAGGNASGTNLVMNGDLSNGSTGWNIGQGSPTSSGVMNGQYCATFSNMTVLIGWGSSSIAANLMSGASYTLSYQASASNGSATTLEVHVGQAVSPYNSDLPDPKKITCDGLQSNPTTFSHGFTSAMSDNTAGIAFLFSSSASNVTACVGNVSITQN